MAIWAANQFKPIKSFPRDRAVDMAVLGNLFTNDAACSCERRRQRAEATRKSKRVCGLAIDRGSSCLAEHTALREATKC